MEEGLLGLSLGGSSQKNLWCLEMVEEEWCPKKDGGLEEIPLILSLEDDVEKLGKNPECLRIHSTGSEGAMCRKWVQENPTESDRAFEKYCQKYPNNPECLCLNRGQNDIYRRLRPKKNNPLYDVCWWTPCQERENYLISSELQGSFAAPDPSRCPPKLCSQVNHNFASQSKINLIEAEALVSCHLDESAAPSWWARWRWWVIGGGMVLLVVVIAVGIGLAVRRKSGKSVS